MRRLAGALDLGLVQRGVGLPELGFVDEVRRGLQGVGQCLQVFELRAAPWCGRL